jgi:hypothetical protein
VARKARPNFLARRQLPQFLRLLKAKPPAAWPKHLAAAWRILCEDLNLPSPQAREVIWDSVEAAHHWVVTQDLLCREIAELEARTEARRACLRISNCLKPERAPASLRKYLNEAAFDLLQNSVIDLEIIESIFDTTLAILVGFPDDESARTARKALRKLRKTNYSSLGAIRGEAEKSINVWASSASQKTAAKDFFATLGHGLNLKDPANGKITVRALTVEYVRSVATSWRRAGLKPTRISNTYNAAFRTKFHLFADLALTAMAEPWALRHDGALEILKRNLQAAYHRAPDDFKRDGSAELRRSDREWLVSDDHVKIALYY